MTTASPTHLDRDPSPDVGPEPNGRADAPSTVHEPRRLRRLGLMVSLVALLAVALLLGVAVGSVALSPSDVLAVVLHHLGLRGPIASRSTDTIVWVVRVPRVLLAAVVGAGLAVVGATLQAVVRNPIADPYLLGISSGASVGAVVVISFGLFACLGVYALSGAAFAGAAIAAIAVLALARGTRGLSPLRVILAGTAVAYASSAIASFLIFRSHRSEAAQSVMFWLLGSLTGASWEKLVPAAIAVVAGSVLLWGYGRHLNALLAGEDTAAALGIDVSRFRRWLLIVSSVMTATVVAVSGSIGFVGLLLPHLGRFLVGTDHRRLLPVCALLGASYLVLIDIGARTLASPEEIPVGIITAGIGAPFFLWALGRSDRRRGVSA